jgi:hypothetical protein
MQGLGPGRARTGRECHAGDTREDVNNGRSAFAHAATELSKPKPASKLLLAFTACSCSIGHLIHDP